MNQENSKLSRDGRFTVKENEKFVVSEEHDYKEWEVYHTTVANSEGHCIQLEELPVYIQDEFRMGMFQSSRSDAITFVKSGLKSGKNLSDPDKKWVEKWFEVSTDDIPSEEDPTAPVQPVVLKYFSKFWTDVDLNMICGEACFQVLSGAHRLKFEMKDQFKVENILTKQGSLKVRTEKITKQMPRMVPAEPETEEQEELKADPSEDILGVLIKQDLKVKERKMIEILVEVEEEVQIKDKYVNDSTPVNRRDIRVEYIQRFLT